MVREKSKCYNGFTMKEHRNKSSLSVAVNRTIQSGVSGYRLIDGAGREIKQVNRYLDTLAVRGLSEKSISTYAYYLLDFWRWKRKRRIGLKTITKNTLLEYIRYQQQTTTPAPATINNRLTIVGCLYQHYFNKNIPGQSLGSQEVHSSIKYRMGWLHPVRSGRVALKVKVPHKIVVPLKPAEAASFFHTFKMWRDLSIVGLMLFCGLRKNEVLSIKLKDLNVLNGQLLVHGKGNRERMVPIPEKLLLTMQQYVDMERPESSNDQLFLVLKGPQRGNPLTEPAIRSLFRHHRRKSGVLNANPHRFRHTFGTEMIKAGLSLAVLMKLMGHAYIQTTMKYVNVSAHDIQDEFNRVSEKLHTKEFLNGTMEPIF